MSGYPHIPEPVRAAVLTRLDSYGINAVSLGDELLMQEGHASVDDFVTEIGVRYGEGEADRVGARIRELEARDADTVRRAGGGLVQRRKNIAASLPRYALLAAPDAEFLNGVEIALAMVAERYAQPGTAEGSDAQDEAGWAIDKLFAKRNVPYRYDQGRLIWVGDQGSRDILIEPALGALKDSRFQGAKVEFEAALAHLRAGSQKDLEDAIDEAAKSVESVLKMLAGETGTSISDRATVKPLFDALSKAGHFPAYMDNLVQAAARVRNQIAGHGSGAEPRVIELDEATATVHGAAAALVFLAARLP